MAELVGNLLVAQSGGPTAVINASIAGVIIGAVGAVGGRVAGEVEGHRAAGGQQAGIPGLVHFAGFALMMVGVLIVTYFDIARLVT